MDTTTIAPVQVAHEFLGSIGSTAPGFSIFVPGDNHLHSSKDWGATCYWPNGDLLRDTACHGTGHTLETAIADMWAKVEKAKSAQRVLKTAAECKEAVLDLIREHVVAPASFWDAVDALPVKS